MLAFAAKCVHGRQLVLACCVLGVLVAAWGIAGAIDICGGCWVSEIVATETANCVTVDGTCKTGTYAVPQYYRCASAGNGMPGRVNCSFNWQQIGTYYACEDNTNWGEYAICVLAVGTCGVTCAASILEPTKLSCIGCGLACAEAAVACPMANYSSCTAQYPQQVHRAVFHRVFGDTCTGQ